MPSSAATEPDPFAGLPVHHNLRDLGGLSTSDGRRVRRGLLFRGASLHRLRPAQLALLAPLGLRTAIDLRTSAETEGGSFPDRAATVHGLPIFERSPEFPAAVDDPAVTLTETYLWMLEQGRETIPRIFTLLTEPTTYPTVIFCAAGKDRTGIVCALVLDQLGVDRAEIAADYALSDAPAQALRRRRVELGAVQQALVPAGIYRAPDRAILGFFDAVQARFGSPDDYLAGLGLPVAETRERLRDLLLEPAE